MAKKLATLILVFLVFGTGIYFYSCRNRNLRGWWKYTSDGKTYLVIEGPDEDSSDPCLLDGRPWPYKNGQGGEIEPGVHELSCPGKIGFKVPAGVEYHFDYWGTLRLQNSH